MKIFHLVLYLIIVLLLGDCKKIDTDKDPYDAQAEINAAVDAKVEECNNNCTGGCNYVPPQPWLYVYFPPNERHLTLCKIAILRTSCPLDAYPMVCLLIYDKKEIGEIPWYFNFYESIKNDKIRN